MVWWLVFVNIGMFVAMAVSTGDVGWSAATLLRWGGNLGIVSLGPEPWRLLTATFLHAGLGHLFGNMILLVQGGRLVEAVVGSGRLLLAYLACGLAASLLSAWSHPQVVSVGASGAVAGLIGMLVVFRLAGFSRDVQFGSLLWLIVLNGFFSLLPGVDGMAHLGGFLAGLGLAVAFVPWLRRPHAGSIAPDNSPLSVAPGWNGTAQSVLPPPLPPSVPSPPVASVPSSGRTLRRRTPGGPWRPGP